MEIGYLNSLAEVVYGKNNNKKDQKKKKTKRKRKGKRRELKWSMETRMKESENGKWKMESFPQEAGDDQLGKKGD